MEQTSLCGGFMFPDLGGGAVSMVKAKQQADRYNDGKPELSYIFDNPEAIDGLSHHFALGSRKYARNNYKKGLPQVQVINSLLRHIKDFNNGVDFGTDDTTGIDYNTVNAILWNALILSQQFYTRPDMDDRIAKKD